jgi:hypothetical protein
MATRIEPVPQALPERRPELDALRMLVVFGLIRDAYGMSAGRWREAVRKK